VAGDQARAERPSCAEILPSGTIRVAIYGTIGSGRSTVRFVTTEIEQTSGSPFVAWHAGSVAASFFRLDEETAMPTYKGTVKWFNPTKGYGFIKPTGGDKDVFVHISAVERAGLTTLNENQPVEYDLVESRGKTSAENLKIL
jgi:CspA family cold shock protein